MRANAAHCEPLPEDISETTAPNADHARLACYPCIHFELIRRGPHDSPLNPECIMGMPACPHAGPSCAEYLPDRSDA